MTNTKYFKPITRIKKVMKFYYDRGINSERVNTIYRKIINLNLKDANTRT